METQQDVQQHRVRTLLFSLGLGYVSNTRRKRPDDMRLQLVRLFWYGLLTVAIRDAVGKPLQVSKHLLLCLLYNPVTATERVVAL